jgi:iron complex outermembrane receptor protein
LYLVNNFDLGQDLTFRLGIAHAERAPTPIERYADGLFLGIIQSGFSRVIGNPNLPKERAWQVDATLAADCGRLRGSLNGFCSWISDYSTFSTTVIPDPTGARMLLGTSTDLATLTGFEIKGECEISDRVDVLASVTYLEGRDREIDAPLPGISPLEGRLGFRLKDLCEGKRWGLEFGVRIVDNQDRLGTLRLNGPGPLPPVVLEQPTPGFTTAYLRGYYHLADEVQLVCGVENLCDRNYLEHLDLRLPPQPVSGGEEIPAYRVLSPGMTAFIGLEWMM